MEKIYNKLNYLEVDKVLDLATGAGDFLEEICDNLKDFNYAVGVDSNQKAIDTATKKDTPGINFRYMDCEQLDFDDQSFDIVSISNSIHHFKNREQVLSEALRVLKLNGLFIVSEMFHSDNERPSQRTHSEFHNWWGQIDTANGIFHGKTFTKGELMEIVQSLSLESVDFEHVDGEDEDIFNEELKNDLTDAYNRYLKRAESLNNYNSLKDEGTKILKRLNEHGFSSSSRLEFVCRK